MDRLIQFRSSIDSFNDNEFELFCQKLFEVYGEKEIIIKSLFFLTVHEFKHNKFDYIHKLNTINKEILDLRRPKSRIPQKKESTTTIKPNLFNSTPATVISYIATYIQTSELYSFIMCNRYIHISCLSIPTIKQFNNFPRYLNNYGTPFRNVQMHKLSRFKMVNEASFDANTIREKTFGVNGIEWVWNKLNCLSLRNVPRCFTIKAEILAIRRGQVLPHQYLINIIKQMEIKQLSLINVHFNRINQKQVDIFLNVLSANKNLEYLSIDNIELRPMTHAAQYVSRESLNLGRIKALSLRKCVDIGDKLLCSVSKQLQSLHIEHYTSQPFDQMYRFTHSARDEISYEDLQELCVSRLLHHLSDSPIINILGTATNLRRIHWNIYDDISDDEKYIFDWIIQDLVEVEYLCVVHLRDWECIMKPLKSASKRENMKIKFKYGRITPALLKHIEDNLEDFVSILSDSITNDFLLECSFDWDKSVEHDMLGYSWIPFTKEDFVGINKKLEKIEQKFSVNFSMKTTMGEELIEIIRISNKHNAMHGYHERWLYPCKECRENIVTSH